MSTLPIETLELRALQQRNQLHRTATELQSKVRETREKLDVRKRIREHSVGAAIVSVAIGLLSGYGVAGIFTRDCD